MGNRGQQPQSSSNRALSPPDLVQQQRRTSPLARPSTQLAPRGRRNEATKFDDDEFVEVAQVSKTASSKSMNLLELLKLEVKSAEKILKLNSKESQTLPVMVSLKSDNLEKASESAKGEASRPGVDLICVIDVSGSMSGDKIDLVKQSMIFLLETMSEQDRLCIITFQSFADRKCPLLRVSPKNVETLRGVINALFASGGTTINAGMDLAFRVLEEKKYKNNVESIFLLSDGQDGRADETVRQNLLGRTDLLRHSNFSVHCFGYGSDHDPKLMKNIADLRDGNFFYIQQLETLNEAFANCLGGLFSVIAQEINVTVESKPHAPFGGVRIVKGFGEVPVLDAKTGAYNMKLMQFLSGVAKNFVFEMSIPPMKAELGDLERNQVLLTARAVVKPVNAKEEPVVIAKELQVTFLNESEQLEEKDPDAEVAENYLRVKAVEVMKENLKLVEEQRFEEAQQHLKKAKEEIRAQKVYQQSSKLAQMTQDMDKMEQQCEERDNVNAHRFMMEVERCHSRQKNFAYQNEGQERFVKMAKARRS